MAYEWYTRKWVVGSLHFLFWLVIFSSPYLLRPVIDRDIVRFVPRDNKGFYFLLFLNNFIRLVLFYANAYILIPRLLNRKKYFQYLLVLILALGFMLIWDSTLYHLLIHGFSYRVWNFFVFNLPFFVFIIIASSAFRLIQDRVRESQLAKERETENLKTELSFLRSQVSPHFMFNVLNNMVALARKKSDDLEPSLIKLSSLLRYMLYETNEDKVLLEKEVEYLQSYIDLQRQRFGKSVHITVDFKLEPGHTIEPMLLIPFVENAFKHGTGMIEHAAIKISLVVEQGILNFSVENNYNDSMPVTKDKTSGIGLNNVKRRLNLLYASHHQLSIHKENSLFGIFLKMNLH